MYSKSQAAFILSARKFFRQSPNVFFWTFTFRKVWPDWYYPRAWNSFMVAMENNTGGFLQGLRVIEIHPGGHGLHYHAILDLRLSVHVVRRFWSRVGGGRVQVDVATKGAAEYLSKYLAKRNLLHKGMRKWGAIGGFKPVYSKDIVIDSAYHRNQRLLGQGRQVPYRLATWVFQMSILWGDWAEWPESIVAQWDELNRLVIKETSQKRLTFTGNPDKLLRSWRSGQNAYKTSAGLPVVTPV